MATFFISSIRYGLLLLAILFLGMLMLRANAAETTTTHEAQTVAPRQLEAPRDMAETMTLGRSVPTPDELIYFKKVRTRLISSWKDTLSAQKEPFKEAYKATMVFEVTPDGKIASSRVKESSGNDAFDKIAQKTLTYSAMPKFLPNMPKKAMAIEFDFAVNYGTGK